jgi:hypothetical protein
MHPYTVPDSLSLTTAGTWDEIPFDNQLMVWQHLGEQERADRYRARVLRFKLKGFVLEDEWRQLSQGIEEYLMLSRTLRLFSLEGVRRRLEASLRGLLTSLFRCDEADQVNVTGEVWRQVAFHIRAVYEQAGGDTPEIRATSADGLHRIRLLLLEMPVGGPYRAVSIRYYGPQRFNTGGVADLATGRGGTMQEFEFGNLQAPVQVRGLDDSRVFENWHLTRDGARGSGRDNAI